MSATSDRDTIIANVFAVLGTERRVRILRTLINARPNPLASSTIGALVGLTDGQTSFNLSAMKDLGIVFKLSHGRYTFYEPNMELLDKISNFLLGDYDGTPETPKVSDNG